MLICFLPLSFRLCVLMFNKEGDYLMKVYRTQINCCVFLGRFTSLKMQFDKLPVYILITIDPHESVVKHSNKPEHIQHFFVRWSEQDTGTTETQEGRKEQDRFHI